MAKDPAFLFYSKDWITGTAEMLPEEKGVYVDLLCYQHQNGDLPNNTKRLSRIVGLSEDEFINIWEVVSEKFIDSPSSNNRLVNRKLNSVMTERKDKGHKNKIIGTFASLMRLADLSKKQYQLVKASFNVDDFLHYDSDKITERLSEWFQERLKSIEDEDVNGDKDENYKIQFDKVKSDIVLPEGFESVILLWLKYKSEKGQSYKDTGLKTLLGKLVKEYKTATLLRETIEYSMSNNYNGIFKEKNNGSSSISNKSVNDRWAGIKSGPGKL